MRRITIWVVSTLALVALAVGFQLNVAGGGGKAGEAGDHGSIVQQQGGTPSTAQPDDSGDSGKGGTDDGKTGGSANDQNGKPGENK